MLTEEAKKSGKEFCACLFESGISAATICEISGKLSDYKVEQEQTFKALLESTKECKTDEEFLAAVRAVLGEKGKIE